MVVLFLLIVAAMHLVMHHHPMALVGKAGEKWCRDQTGHSTQYYKPLFPHHDDYPPL
jgi:hypothetical protein